MLSRCASVLVLWFVFSAGADAAPVRGYFIAADAAAPAPIPQPGSVVLACVGALLMGNGIRRVRAR